MQYEYERMAPTADARLRALRDIYYDKSRPDEWLLDKSRRAHDFNRGLFHKQ